jgi:hypothetical protein
MPKLSTDLNKTRVVRTAGRTTRPAADEQGERLSERVTYPYPPPHSLGRCWPWESLPQTVNIERVAHHEAGHAVIGEWLGLPGIRATAEPSKGLMKHGLDFGALPAPGPDEDGRLAGTAASLFLGGFAAELIWAGRPWAGPVHCPAQADFQNAEAMLAPRFGRLSSAGHGYATRVALSVLSESWPRVQEIAAILAKHGEWKAAG